MKSLNEWKEHLQAEGLMQPGQEGFLEVYDCPFCGQENGFWYDGPLFVCGAQCEHCDKGFSGIISIEETCSKCNDRIDCLTRQLTRPLVVAKIFEVPDKYDVIPGGFYVEGP